VFIKFPFVAEDSQSNLEETTEANQDLSIEGLIHISELDWQLVQNPNEIVKVGEVVKAKIINISNNQVFLSLKSLKENPWEEVEKKYKKDDIIKGKVISVSPFGAFVEVLPQIRGLCHISEFSSQQEMQESLKVGETYDFKILLIEPKEHRMSLKLVEKK
jgi:small subunit ribosomal protein S1